ncbi:MAG: hypothetical protein HRU38_24260, partial [Saccharospirillaceae bacterium]|nr:hypothetical protein [Pseudomonadales bacterium]NRB81736.1 hypothetical protein [Saccharospirillaceae bacterium]
MKNQLKAVTYSQFILMFKRLGVFITLSLFLAVNAYADSCPAIPAWCVDGVQKSEPNPAAGKAPDICFYHSAPLIAALPDAMPPVEEVLHPVTFTGEIKNGRSIYVSENTILTLNSNYTYTGEIVNCGTLILLQGNYAFGGSSKLTNYGDIEDQTNEGFKIESRSLFTNHGNYNSNTQLNIKGNAILKNYGVINTQTLLKVYNNATLENHGKIYIKGGDFVTEGTVINKGLLDASNFINFNSNSKTTTNDCTFIARGGFNAYGQEFINNGYVIIKKGNDASFKNKLITGNDSFISGINLINGAIITGYGSFFFSGSTTNDKDIFDSVVADDGSIDVVDLTFNKDFSTGNGHDVSGVTVDASLIKLKDSARVESCNDLVKDLVITIKDVTGDNIFSLDEIANATKNDGTPIPIEGTANVADGIIVTVTIQDMEYPAVVTNNEWSIPFPFLAVDLTSFIDFYDGEIKAQIVKDDSDPDSFSSNIVDVNIKIEQTILITDIETVSSMEGGTTTETIIISGTTGNVAAMEKAIFTWDNPDMIPEYNVETTGIETWAFEFPSEEVLNYVGQTIPIKIMLLENIEVNDVDELEFTKVDECPVGNLSCQDVDCTEDTCIEVCLVNTGNTEICVVVVLPCTDCPTPTQTILITDIKTVSSTDEGVTTEMLIISGTTENVAAMEKAIFTWDNPDMIPEYNVETTGIETWAFE